MKILKENSEFLGLFLSLGYKVILILIYKSLIYVFGDGFFMILW